MLKGSDIGVIPVSLFLCRTVFLYFRAELVYFIKLNWYEKGNFSVGFCMPKCIV